ncbi:gliding motility-associated C-terminal domain-containing protein [Psychroflexus aestuariivivens]|uniref:gliding motility-associated C-terminal domain-containing protein n=1 Tax=Psychroflexus aestuariivivens TaxID=1795040 RepID=UPI000FD93BAF|nr:gliding motility-associated C-terminal domain-containing protein [Psychroflexus aestuariivivens]
MRIPFNLPKVANPFLFFYLIFSLFTIQNLNAQCAGSNASVTICDITDPENQNLNLFNLLNGNPETGGTWESNVNIFVNQDQGIVNIWNLIQGGTYVFNYTVENDNCGIDTASVALIVGGYPGTDNFTANACEDDTSVNLYQFISSSPNPHFFGEWTDVNGTGGLSENTFNATVPEPGTYTFIYTVPAVGDCSEKTATVELTVHPIIDPGESSEMVICGEEQLQEFTNVDLNQYLSGNYNGNWFEASGTSQIENNEDSVINLQEIYNNFGYGIYIFNFNANPSHPICDPVITMVTFEIYREIDYSDAELNVDSFCINELNPSGIFAEIVNLPLLEDLPSNSLVLQYEIAGPDFFQGQTQVEIANPTSFNLNPNFNLTPGEYTISITGLGMSSDPDGLICNIIFELEDTFEIYEIEIEDLELEIENICFGENVTVTVTSPDPNFDENFTLEYNITGANELLNQTEGLIFVNGQASFEIDSNLFTNAGNHTLTATNISNEFCTEFPDLSDDFEIYEIPESNINISVNNVCLGEDLSISLSNLSNLNNIEIEYEITGSENFGNVISLQVDNGSSGFVLSGNNFLTEGNYNIEIVSITNLDSECNIILNNNTDFEIYEIPPPPNTDLLQEFCEVDQNQISDLVPNGVNYFWYDSQNSTLPLSDNIALTEGEYWLAQSNENNCISDKTPVSIIINEVPNLTMISEGNEFCGSDEPQIQDLSLNTDQFSNYNIIWLDEIDGNSLSDETLLMNNQSYYGIVSDPVTGCESTFAVEITVSLNNCDSENYEFLVPDGFSPNGDGVNDVFRILDIEFIYPSYEFEIYNRYGKLLFKGNKDKPSWNGESTEDDALMNGVAPNGVYFYVLHFNKNNRSSEQGRLYLNR